MMGVTKRAAVAHLALATLQAAEDGRAAYADAEAARGEERQMPETTWTQTPQIPGRYWLQWADWPRPDPLLVHVYQNEGLHWCYEFASGECSYVSDVPGTWFYGPVITPVFSMSRAE